MMLCTLYSGSKGNAALVCCGGVKILIDAGKSARALKRALGEMGCSPDELDAILITHEHCDHISVLENPVGLPDIPVHAAGGCADKLAALPSYYIQKNLVKHPPLFELTLGTVRVTSFVTPHDSAASVGYRIEWEEDGVCHAIGYATDVGYLSKEVIDGLSGCEAVVIEANHDIDMLWEGPYPYHLKRRILSPRGHLCNTDCADLAASLYERGTRAFLLAHLSEKNNHPDLAYDAVASVLPQDNVVLMVADGKLPTRLL
jgi:phosphoribosyl 1,2-cyclic phosphodiesterase